MVHNLFISLSGGQANMEILSNYDEVRPHAFYYLNPLVYNDHHCCISLVDRDRGSVM